MLYIRTLLSPRSRTTQEAQVNHLLSKVGVTGRGELVGQFGGSLLQSLTKSMAPDKFMKVLLSKLQDLQTPQEKAKLLTVMHSAVWQSGYSGNVLQELSNLNFGGNMQSKNQSEDWFVCLYRAYLSYLTKLPSVSQVYARARSEGDVWYDSKTLLVDLFRLVNQINLLLDPLISTFNTVGRYYKEKKKVFRPMYQLLWRQLALLYSYMQRAVDSLFVWYQGVGADKLKVFLDSVPQLELMADRLQQFLMNKYFEGVKPEKRLYFKAEEVAKIDYYLKHHDQ